VNIKAIFHGKDPELELKNCVFDRVVFLPDDQYQQCQKNLLEEYDFISMYRDEMYREGDTVHCILVKGMNSSDGVLVNSEGFGYARYTAYLPAAQAFLNEQKLLQEQETTPEPVRREITQEELAMMYGQHILWAEGGDGVGEQAVFSNCLLSGLDMRGMQFNNAIFWDTTFEQMDMQGAGVCFSEFQGAHFINCSMDNLCADEANFRGCTFEGCSLRRAKLLHCNLTQAQFQNTSLSGADLRWSCVDGIRAEDNVLEQANTKNVSFSECAWIEEATPGKEPAMEMSSM
jgi:uncharacterized protein YjbI with pentapeptide repeats